MIELDRHEFYKTYQIPLKNIAFINHEDNICIFQLSFMHDAHATFEASQYTLIVKIVAVPDYKVEKEYTRHFISINGAVKYINKQIAIYYKKDLDSPLDYEQLKLNWYLADLYKDYKRYGLSEEAFQKHIAEHMDEYKAQFIENTIISIEPRMFEEGNERNVNDSRAST